MWRYAASITADKLKAPILMVQRFLRYKHPGSTDLHIGNIHSDLAPTMEQSSSGCDTDTPNVLAASRIHRGRVALRQLFDLIFFHSIDVACVTNPKHYIS
jgi:hypothetical protein